MEVVHEVQTPLEKLVVDILWSDPTDSDNDLGIQANQVRDPHGTGNIVKFGPDIVKEFLARNKLDKIIRAHECVMDGFERFAGGDLLTVFSATDYCGKHKNAGAILTITKTFVISPKLIYPNLHESAADKGRYIVINSGPTYREGHDYVGSIRDMRRGDAWWRGAASKLLNRIREKTTRIKMTDQGCMLRAYSRRIVELINQTREVRTFIPALAYTFAMNPTEVVVGHEERFAGESKYSLYSLIRLNFDLMTGFSVVPLQVFSLIGTLVSLLSGVLVVYLGGRRLILGPEEGGLFTLFAIAFLLIGLALFGIGLLGEYIGRIYQEVRKRPRFVIRKVLEQDNN